MNNTAKDFANRCQRCNRVLKDQTAQYGWRCAEILGVAQTLNHVGDKAFLRYIWGIEGADKFLQENGIDPENIDLTKFYEAFTKLCLVDKTSNQELWELAYSDLQDSLVLHSNKALYKAARSPALSTYLDIGDIDDYLLGQYTTTAFTPYSFNRNVEFLQRYMAKNGIKDRFGEDVVADGIYGPQTDWSIANTKDLKKFGDRITIAEITARTDMPVPNWDEENLNYSELQAIEKTQWRWQNAQRMGDTQAMEVAYRQAESIRERYRMSYQYTDSKGVTRVDSIKYNDFNDAAMQKNGTRADEIPEYVIAGVIASQLDSPVPGPADLVGLAIIAGGFIISQATAYFSRGKSNPHDLEKGMSARQRDKFQREIENYKKGGGMPPNYNIPWEILVEIAREIREMYK